VGGIGTGAASGNNPSRNVIQGNFIGTNPSGTRALGSGGVILSGAINNLIGGTAPGEGNLISGFGDNVQLMDGSSGNKIQGNKIGTDTTGTISLTLGLAPFGNGVRITRANNNLIGGTEAGAGNLISGNPQDGVLFAPPIGISSTGNLIQGNKIGTDITGTVPLPNGGFGVELDRGANSNTIGGATDGAGNLISGNRSFGVIIGYTQGLADNNFVQGNKIGTDITGTVALGNGDFSSGVVVEGAGNVIGGTSPGAGNLISGNAGDGVVLYLTTGPGNVVQGNRIGTNADGTKALGNGGAGVRVTGPTYSATIGGTADGAGNLISGNGGDGVLINNPRSQFIPQPQPILVQGNLIGTDVTGQLPLGNGGRGVNIVEGYSDVIGGPSPGTQNSIAFNNGDGVFVNSGSGELIRGNSIIANGGRGITIAANDTTVQGNFIGTDVSGDLGLGNGSDGIAILNASNTMVGGTTSATANVIAANGGSGVLISGVNAKSNLIEGNFIGTDASATINLGNAADGVTIRGASNNTIGGMAAGAGNTIAFNGNDGVLVDTGTGNAILSDLIFSSDNLGIELINNGNHNQAAPGLTSAVEDGVNTVIQGVLQSTANTTFTVQLFSDPSADPSGSAEGQQLLGTITVRTDAFGFAAFTVTIPKVVPAGQVVTATATDANNNTSEFSAPVTVTAA
jgi:titin